MTGLPYTLNEIQTVTGGKLISGTGNDIFQTVSIHSGEILPGHETVFIAIKTANRDGHQFIREAYEKGVRNFIVSAECSLPLDCSLLLVENTILALQSWATFHRKKFNIPVIGITGSNGKTTVKEWLSTLVEGSFQFCKSPKSFNSQIGVPLSVLGISQAHEIAFFEAGISTIGEMEKLREIIQPTLGILTHLGSAHAEGFTSFEEKVREKLILFRDIPILLTPLENLPFLNGISAISPDTLNPHSEVSIDNRGWEISFEESELNTSFILNVPGETALQNYLLSVLAARQIGLDWQTIQSNSSEIGAVKMRLEFITSNPAITLINDTYNADSDSVLQAFQLLKSDTTQPSKFIILSDLEHLGKNSLQMHEQLLDEAIRFFTYLNIGVTGPQFKFPAEARGVLWADTPKALLYKIGKSRLNNHTVLLKGSRKFSLESLIPELVPQVHASYLTINLDAIKSNFRIMKSRLAPDTKTMAMVKASAYGTGLWEVSSELEKAGADFLSVAYTSEGIQLREKGIRLPIMVMNPDPATLDQLLNNNLQPAISSLALLETYHSIVSENSYSSAGIHIEVETGMMRLGFKPEELTLLLEKLRKYKSLKPISVFTHLAGAEDPEEDFFSLTQIEIFKSFCSTLFKFTGPILRHVSNSAGIIRFKDFPFEMVRMGIGLYGVSPVAGFEEFKEVVSLISTISQIHNCPPGTGISYNRSYITKRQSRIATIPVGYADGIPRNLGNEKISFLIRNQRVPVVGKICMDMLMVDITDVPEAKEGDEVLIFGSLNDKRISLNELATASGTIPYEILTHLSQRLHRVYSKE